MVIESVENYSAAAAKALEGKDLQAVENALRDISDMVTRRGYEGLLPDAVKLIDRLSDWNESKKANYALLQLARAVPAFRVEPQKLAEIKGELAKCTARFVNKVIANNLGESERCVGVKDVNNMLREAIPLISTPNSVEANYLAQLRDFCTGIVKGTPTINADTNDVPFTNTYVEALKERDSRQGVDSRGKA